MKGRTWDQFHVGETTATTARTVTEPDLVSFVSWFGFVERLFMEAGYSEVEGYAGRLVPAALTFSIAEGLTLQTGDLHGTGLAFLGADIRAVAPVYVGDTLTVKITVTEARASRTPGRGVVVTNNDVVNQTGQRVLQYRVIRMVRGPAGPSENEVS